MATPREILNRVAGNRSIIEQPQPENTQERKAPVVQREAAVRPVRENSVYRQLMRSHDRVRTRHIQG